MGHRSHPGRAPGDGCRSGGNRGARQAYEPYARELARDIGLEGRTSFRIVDILDEPDAVEPADIVVLNRVVCCSADGVELAAAAARLARRTLVLSFPRDVIWLRAGIRLLNASLRLRRSPFRAYVHQPGALFAAVDSEAFKLDRRPWSLLAVGGAGASGMSQVVPVSPRPSRVRTARFAGSPQAPGSSLRTPPDLI